MTAATLLLLLSAGAQAETIYVPSTYTRLSDAVSHAAQNGETNNLIVIDGQDSRWSPSAETYVAVYTDLSIESANQGVPVELPGLKIYDCTVSLTDVDVVGYYDMPSDSDYMGVQLATRVLAVRAQVTFADSDLSYDANDAAETGLVAYDSRVTLVDVTLNDYPDERAATVLAEWEAAGLTMSGGEVAGNGGGGLSLLGTLPDFSGSTGSLAASLDGVSFTDNEHEWNGGAIEAWLLESLSIVDSQFVGNGAGLYGGALSADGVGALIIEGSSFDGERSDGGSPLIPTYGVGIELAGSDEFASEVAISDTSFVNLAADLEYGEGGAIYSYAVDLSLTDVVAQDLAAGGGALLYAAEGTVDAERVQLSDYRVGVGGGAIYLFDVDPNGDHFEHSLRQLSLCGGDSARYEADAVALVLESSFVSIENGVFLSQTGTASPLIAVYDADLLVSHSTFAANELDTLILALDAPGMWLDANILDGGGHAQMGVEQLGQGELFGASNLWWGFLDTPWTAPVAFEGDGELDSQLLDADPLFMFPGTFASCPGAAYVYWDSPAVDAATSYSQQGNGLEWDGSYPDIGAAGGTPYTDYDAREDDTDGDGLEDRYDCDPDRPNDLDGAETWYDGLDYNCDRADDYDADSDGWRGQEFGEDCDDNDARVHPGASELWYDGVDQDCDGLSDYDADGDGFDAEGYGEGGDCDDADPEVNPGAVDVWYDGVDQNCDERDDYDADGDGAKSDRIIGGTDCDDEDPTRHPAATEVPNDDIDQDCDGVDLIELTDGKSALSGGCSSAPVAPARAWLLLALGLLLTRRRSLRAGL
ncbi:MAG: putative metal-binding motif-containing protein [Alphaproteobacteria bacterium]|nr:putative metal-binding motif-containing protein [Alphaproteobacteria bacterium]MCB9791797.1 putative metal-binding motif-containing protein [Alphaproteobacteria bacterium]